MKSRNYRKEKPGLKKGEFLEKKRSNQRRTQIYMAINDACKKAIQKGSAELIIDNKKFYLTDHPCYNDTHFYAFVRMTRLGIVLTEVCVKDSGWMNIKYPYCKETISGINSFIWDNIVAYIKDFEILSHTSNVIMRSIENQIEEEILSDKKYREMCIFNL